MKTPIPLSIEVIVASVAACLIERPRRATYAVVPLVGNPPPQPQLLQMMEEYAEFDDMKRYADSPSFLCHVQGTICVTVGEDPWSDFAGHSCCRENIARLTEDVVRVFANISAMRQELLAQGEELGPASEKGPLAFIAGLLMCPQFDELFLLTREIARELVVGARGKNHLRLVH